MKITKTSKQPVLIENDNNLNIEIEKNIQAEIILITKSNKSKLNQKINIQTKEKSSLTIYHVQINSKKTIHSLTKTAKLEKNSKLNWIDIHLGNKELNFKLKNELKTNSKSSTKCITFTKDNQIYNIEQETVHKSKSSHSETLHRGILNNKSLTSSKFKIKIEKNCPNSKAYQKSENILLSNDCNCTSTPILEVETDNVSCSHGASISHINEDKLFYLLSRSLNENEAKQIILEGFITEWIENEKVKELILKEVQKNA